MKSILFLAIFIGFGLSNFSWANSYIENLRTDLEKLTKATEEFDFENYAFKEDDIHIDQDIARAWANEQFGSLEAFTEIFVRIKTSLDYLAKDKDKPNSTAEDYKQLILSLTDSNSHDSSREHGPFTCYNAYVKGFSMCTAYGVVGEYGGSGSDCGIYLLHVAQTKRKFYSCIEENYGK